MRSCITKGKYGERIAAKFLQSKGYKLHFTNYRLGRLEVDLVCEVENTIIVVEVKALSSLNYKLPFESVRLDKQRKIIQVADHLLKTRFMNRDCRFDIVSIYLSNNGPQIEHIEDAFIPEIGAGY
jgi:putative endonuclease